MAAVSASLDSLWLAPGSQTEAFEAAICEYHGHGFSAVALSSGTAALFLALYGLGVGENDEVLIPSYSCSALLNAIHMVGGQPIVVDVDPASWNISATAAAAAVTSRTRALIVTHAFGVPAEIEPLLAIGIPVIEDCAQSIGAEIAGRKVGCDGVVSTFSFFATKMLTTGHGGMVMSSDHDLIEKILDYRSFDCRETYIPRFNFQMADFQAALGNSQIGRFEGFMRRRRAIGERYRAALTELVDGWQRPRSEASIANGYRHVALVKDAAAVISAMDRQGISAAIPIKRYELLHRYLKLDPSLFPVAEGLPQRTLSLPAFPALDDAQLDRVIESAREALA
jgi:perosamine synthetase